VAGENLPNLLLENSPTSRSWSSFADSAPVDAPPNFGPLTVLIGILHHKPSGMLIVCELFQPFNEKQIRFLGH
jgi:hypothetical protein